MFIVSLLFSVSLLTYISRLAFKHAFQKVLLFKKSMLSKGTSFQKSMLLNVSLLILGGRCGRVRQSGVEWGQLGSIGKEWLQNLWMCQIINLRVFQVTLWSM